jgi:hypothetical protein
MRSLKQRKASRINGARSNGPATPEGKNRIAHNAIKHGLTAKAVVLSNEDPALFNLLFQSFLDRFQPADDPEFLLVERMAAAEWRLRRSWSIETALIDLAMVRGMEKIEATVEELDETTRAAFALEDLAKERTLSNIQHQESRLERQYNRACTQLMLLQAARKSAQPVPAPSDQPPAPPLTKIPPPQPTDSKPPAPQQKILKNEPEPPSDNLYHLVLRTPDSLKFDPSDPHSEEDSCS